MRGNITQIVKEKWKSFSQQSEVPDWYLEQQANLDMVSEELEREEASLRLLAKQPGMTLLLNYMTRQIEMSRSKLEKASMKDDREELMRVQAEAKAWRKVRGFVLSKIGHDVV